jgi:hypothetical protein
MSDQERQLISGDNTVNEKSPQSEGSLQEQIEQLIRDTHSSGQETSKNATIQVAQGDATVALFARMLGQNPQTGIRFTDADGKTIEYSAQTGSTNLAQIHPHRYPENMGTVNFSTRAESGNQSYAQAESSLTRTFEPLLGQALANVLEKPLIHNFKLGLGESERRTDELIRRGYRNDVPGELGMVWEKIFQPATPSLPPAIPTLPAPVQ